MKKTILTILAVGALLTFLAGNLFPFFCANDSCVVYNNCDPEIGLRAGASMGQLIAQGGGCFLTSNSEIMKFLNRVEMFGINGIDYNELREILGLAVSNMENAAAIYKNIISIAKETPYDPLVIAKLKDFDYQGYAEKHMLNGDIWAKVKNYLIAGDVTGAYIQIESDMNGILKQLYKVQETVNSNQFPEISQLWRVIQSYNVSLLFGSYMSEVFMNL